MASTTGSASYKYCIVPTCTNTTRKSPGKYFFPVPQDKALRVKWCTTMKRDKEPLSCTTSHYCCEDHFDIEVDVENLVQYKLVGGKLKLKKGVIPHRFNWQEQTHQVPKTKSTSEPPPPELPSPLLMAGMRNDDVSREFDGHQQVPTSPPEMSSMTLALPLPPPPMVSTQKDALTSPSPPSLGDQQYVHWVWVNVPPEQSAKKSVTYKYCLVPKCTNTNRKCPSKYFFSVPMEKKMRKKWCNAMKRDDKKPLSCKTTLYCCEDHFDVEADVSNLLKCKLVGGKMKLKKGVLPHRFDCQQRCSKNTKTRSAVERRRKLSSIIDESMFTNTNASNEQTQTEALPVQFVSCNDTEEPNDPLNVDSLNGSCVYIRGSTTNKTSKTKAVQTNMQMKDKECQTKKKQNTVNKHTFTNYAKRNSLFIESEYESASTSEKESERSLDISTSVDLLSNEKDEEYVKSTIVKIEHNPQLYLGLRRETYFLVGLLVEQVHRSQIDILITLKKIRLNDSFARLAIDFSLTKGYISKIFGKTVVAIAHVMNQLIYFPDQKKVEENLPVAFRNRFRKTQSIIDCFEVRIQKPSNALHQSLTWSENKGCNTLKYLISITPDGFINYVSDGYGGRVTDSTLFEDCNILHFIPPGAVIMAYRGFKYIAPVVESRGCKLIRPPSVKAGIASSKSEVIETKRIAAMRIHVERAIGRLRNFKMLALNAGINTKMIHLFDNVVLIACGLVNLC